MTEDIKHIIVGIIKSFIYSGGIKVSDTLIPFLTDTYNWHYVDSKTQIINNTSTWCFEYIGPENSEEYFLQVELQIERKTVVAVNVISNEENKITAYSK